MKRDETRLTVVNLTGGGRSGSTILGNVLGQAPGLLHVGELCYLWNRGVRLDALCGCGEAFSRCPVWSQVMADPDVARFRSHQRQLERFPRAANRRLPLMMLDARLAGRTVAASRIYAAQLDALYRALARATGARAIIDSSKTPSHVHVLARMPGIDLRVIHLLRDPRAVAHSWHRSLTRTDLSEDRPRQMERTSVVGGALKWAYSNALIDVSTRRLGGDRLLRLRYEEVVRDPVAAMACITALAGLDDTRVPFAENGSIDLGATHTVWGNPNRLKTGPMRLRADDDWRGSMPPVERLAVTAITWPLLVRYGYPLGSPPGPA